MTRSYIPVVFLALSLLLSPVCCSQGTGPSNDGPFLIGRGIYDITGPPGDVQFAGMVNVQQKGQGLYMRLRSRAFIIQDPQSKASVVLVTVELGQYSQDLHLAILKRLEEQYGNLYTERNVLISATHTHNGPGGYFGHWGLNLAIGLGFCRANFDTIVNGVVASIKRAHDTLSPGTILMASGQGSHKIGGRFSCSRSPEAYLNNPKEELDRYRTEDGSYDEVNRRITVLKFVRADGTAMGMVVWCPAHPHVAGRNDRLINGDTIGYACYLLEREEGTDYLSSDTFVAAMAMNDAGDSMGWLPEDEEELARRSTANKEIDTPSHRFDYWRVRMRAETIYRLTKELYDAADQPLHPGVASRQMFVRFPGFRIDPKYIAPDQVKYEQVESVREDINNICVCEPVIGLGVGLTGRPRNVTSGEHRFERIDEIPANLIAEDRKCHLEKINVLHVGRGDLMFSSLVHPPPGAEYIVPGAPAVPEVLPVQVLKVGDLAILALPFEVTTMSGRRLRERLMGVMEDVCHVEINAIANGYMCYMTTREEYAIQCYEGGQNWFGPYTLNALTQMFCDLGRSFARDVDLPDYALGVGDVENTLDLVAGEQVNVGSVDFDAIPEGRRFGDVVREPSASYGPGESVVARFLGGHPNNDFQIQSSYLFVEGRTEQGWTPVAMDWDPSTYTHWTRRDHVSEITVEWVVPCDALSGEYRMRHRGHWKDKATGKITPYEGVTKSFSIAARVPIENAIRDQIP